MSLLSLEGNLSLLVLNGYITLLFRASGLGEQVVRAIIDAGGYISVLLSLYCAFDMSNSCCKRYLI